MYYLELKVGNMEKNHIMILNFFLICIITITILHFIFLFYEQIHTFMIKKL